MVGFLKNRLIFYFYVFSAVDAFIARMSQKTVDMNLTVTRPLGSFAVLQVNLWEVLLFYR